MFIFLVMWTVITVIFTIASLGTNWIALVTFLVFDVAIILLDIGAALNSADLNKAGGWFELLAALAWYIVMAEITNETLHRTVFPLFPFKRS